MRILRTHRRTITAALAAAALVVQAVLPHVHAWQAGDHGAALVFAAAGQGERIAAATHDADHERAACPTCQALAQSRQLAAAPRTIALVFVPVRAGDSALRADALASRDHVAPSAPRAPPVSA